MATFRHALSCVAVGAYIYAIGGWVDGSVSSPDCERYCTRTDVWEMLAPLPTPRRLLGAALVGDSAIYIFGGSREDKEAWYTDAAERYIISEDRWEVVRRMPSTGACSAAAVCEKYCYVFVHSGAVVRYDIEADSYTTLCDALPEVGWASFDTKPLGRRSILVAGGARNGKSSKVVYRFDTLDFSWTRLPDMTVGRRRTGLAVVKV